MTPVKILGVDIFSGLKIEALEEVEKWLKDGSKKRYIVTPNPEILMIAQKNETFRKILNEADLALPDGVGLIWASRILGKPLKERITGVDFMEKVCELAAKEGFTVGLIGGRDGVALKAAERLKKAYPKLKLVLAQEEWEDNLKIENRNLSSSIDILFVAFGAPKQEIWVNKHLNDLPIKVAMGVGGSFDYFAGLIPRAPKWIQNLGFEWLYRLIQQPWRIRRQLALLKFMGLVFKERYGL